MSEHKATITWKRTSPEFLKGKYSREHSWTFDGGLTIPASPSPSVVPMPYSNPANIDPEEAYVASISSCHMLTFLFIASRQGFQVDSYEDEAIGAMTKNEKGVSWISSVTLTPKRRETSHARRRGAIAPPRTRAMLPRQLSQNRNLRHGDESPVNCFAKKPRGSFSHTQRMKKAAAFHRTRSAR